MFSEVELTELRLKREELFLELWETEQLIQQTLGAPYTFETLPDLPSHKKKRVGSRAKKAAKVATFKLRALEGEEVYYQLSYEQSIHDEEEGTLKRELQTYLTADGDSIRAFMKAGEKCLDIRKIETVLYSEDDGFSLAELLYEKKDDLSV